MNESENNTVTVDHKHSGCSSNNKNNNHNKLQNINSNTTSSKADANHCLHDGCKLTFESQEELRNHLYSDIPGIAEEYKFLKNSVLKLSEIVLTWETKSKKEKVSKSLCSLCLDSLSLEINDCCCDIIVLYY